MLPSSVTGLVISIHAPLAGCDGSYSLPAPAHPYFNPRTPCGVRPFERGLYSSSSAFQSTHPLRGATFLLLCDFAPRLISIHAPLAGCDFCSSFFCLVNSISIHAPLAGCDDLALAVQDVHDHFNPRTPCGVRPCSPPAAVRRCHFNPRTPCGVRPPLSAPPGRSSHFNPRTPCGVRRASFRAARTLFTFQSTHPLRGATIMLPVFNRALAISIHAPLAGCDSAVSLVSPNSTHFNPRTPCGVRPRSYAGSSPASRFQSTHPLRGATIAGRRHDRHADISIHAPLAGCDWFAGWY